MELSSADLPLVPIRRGLKRSASTASLPTPPRTHRRRARGLSRGSCDSDSDAEQQEKVILSSDEEDNELPQIGHKASKRRRLNNEVVDDEDSFWLAGPDSKVEQDKVAEVNVSDNSVPLIYRKSRNSGLASPPPSNRKSQVITPITPPPAAGPSSSPLPAPVTPKKQTSLFNRLRKRAKSPEFPIISNSPDNPFYVASSPDDDSASPPIDSSPITPTVSNYIEKPTVTYVFRGVRREFHNPMYNHAENRPMSPPPTTLLPIEHPDYSPDITCKPTVLFPQALKGKGKSKVASALTKSSTLKSNSKSKSDSEIVPATVHAKSNLKSKSTVNSEFKLAPAPALAPAPSAQSNLRRSPKLTKTLTGGLFNTKVDEEDEDHATDDEDEDEDGGDIGTLIKPKKLDFGPPKMRSVNVDLGMKKTKTVMTSSNSKSSAVSTTTSSVSTLVRTEDDDVF